MAKEKIGLTRDQMLKQALEKFSLNSFRTWIKRFDKGLWNSFKNASEATQKATMCKCICNRTDMLGSEAHKKARQWLKEHNTKGQIW